MTASGANRTISDVVCAGCGCLCDDLTVELDGTHVLSVEPRCDLAEQHFADRPSSAHTYAVDGRSASLGDAAMRAAEILSTARAPLVMGLERATTESVRKAIEIADLARAYADPTDDRGQSQNHVATQTVGAITATLGEAANRADLLVYWFVDPAKTHPRHMQRLRKNAARTVVVDSRETETAKQADQLIRLDDQRQFDAICTLRQLVRQRQDDADDSTAGPAARAAGNLEAEALALDELGQLAEELTSAQYAVFVHQPNDSPQGAGALGQAVVELIGDLHLFTRAAAIRLGRAANAVGASQALTWQTGYPAAVSFRRGYPEYLPGEANAELLLARGEVDAALIVGADPLEHCAGAALERLRAIPTIVLDDRETTTTSASTVAIQTARFGISEPGTIYRSDGIALPLERIAASSAPPAATVLAAIRERIVARVVSGNLAPALRVGTHYRDALRRLLHDHRQSVHTSTNPGIPA